MLKVNPFYGAWSADSKTEVASMESGDFTEVKISYYNQTTDVKIECSPRWYNYCLKKVPLKVGRNR
jgi:monomeric isocitrate dehydrogenase